MNTAGIEKTQANTCLASVPHFPAMQATRARNLLYHVCRDYPVYSVQRRSHGKDFTIKSMPRLRNKSDLRTRYAGTPLFYEAEHFPVGYADKKGHYTYSGIGSRKFNHG